MNTSENLQKLRFLSGNQIKVIAAVLMVIDHIGMFFLPNGSFLYALFRILGRISFPLFAYMLAEGCRYTKNKLTHFALLFSIAMLCQIVYYFFGNGNLSMSVLVTFSLSTAMIYALQYCKQTLFDKEKKPFDKILSVFLFFSSIAFTYFLNLKFTIDYFFWGCMLPVLVSLFDCKGLPMPEKWRWLDGYLVKIFCLAIGLFLLAFTMNGNLEYWAFLSLPFLLLYNGKRGKYKMKYFFYIFYPAQFVILEGISLLILLIGG
jgi:hypothetical protein